MSLTVIKGDGFRITRGSDALHRLADGKDMEELIDAADFALSPDDREETDVFQEGIRIGLKMAETGVKEGVELCLFDEGGGQVGFMFLGSPAEVRRRIAALPDAEE